MPTTFVDAIYTHVLGLEKHGRVHEYGFGPTPISVFVSGSKRRSTTSLVEQLEHVEEKFEITQGKLMEA